MNPAKTSFLFPKQTLILTVFWVIVTRIPTPAHPLLIEPSRTVLSPSPIVFSAPDLTGNGRPDDRQGGASSHRSGSK